MTTRDIITIKIPQNKFILRSDRQAISAVLIDAIIRKLGTRYIQCFLSRHFSYPTYTLKHILIFICSPSKQALEQLARDLVNTYPVLGDIRRKNLGYQM